MNRAINSIVIQCKVNNDSWFGKKNVHISNMKNDTVLQNLADFDNKSLLIVDDDNPFRERLARAMEKKGFEVIQAEGVKKGIDSVKTTKPGFAVVDLRLGDGNGLEVVTEFINFHWVIELGMTILTIDEGLD